MTSRRGNRFLTHRPGIRAKLVRPLVAGVGVAVLAAAHVHVRSQEATYTGLLLAIDHAFDVVVALLLFIICGAIGRYALARCRFSFDRPLEVLSFSTAIGAGIVSVAILVCGLLSLLHPAVLGIVLLLGAFIARRELRDTQRLWAQSLEYLSRRSEAQTNSHGTKRFWNASDVSPHINII